MSDYDLIPSGEDYGAVRPYQPSPAPLPTTTPATIDQGFYDTDQSLPAGVSQQQIDQFMGEVSGLFIGDMARLNMDRRHVQKAVDWYQQNAFSSRGEPQRHRFNLSGLAIPREDLPLVHAFANAMANAGADETFVRNSIWWCYELAKRLTQNQPQPQSSQSQTFTDAEWDYCVKRSKTDQLNCENALRAAWGYETPAKLEIVFNYVATCLSAGERAYLQNTVTKGGLALANDPGTIQKLYLAAVGGNNIPKGAALADEIQAIEKTIGTPAYWRDESKQARLRFLYQLRDGS